jgi:DNA-directed RNA polymerase specialized sigma24 family protein
MLCDEATVYFRNYLHGELTPGLMRGVQLHLEGCKKCRDSLAALRPETDAVIPFYLVASAHGETSPEENAAVERHLHYCMFCADEFKQLRAAANELTKNLSQYQLSRTFRPRVMQEWRPHRVGKRKMFQQRGLADMLERAEAGNTFSYERHVDRFKHYAYVSAFLQVRDFHWAEEIAYEIFATGMPAFDGDLTQVGFLAWIDRRVGEIAKRGDWLGKGESLADDDEGLSGYTGSHKLRRHRIIRQAHNSFEKNWQVPFLFYHVQRLSYAEIAGMLGLERLQVQVILADATRAAAVILKQDEKAHPRLRRVWER